MANVNAKHDDNSVPTALFAQQGAVSFVAPGQIDQITGRILVDISGGTNTSGTEVPTGTIDGSNTTFTTINPPAFITVGGVSYFPNDGFTFTGSGPYTLTLTQAPFPNQTIHSVYFSTSVVTPGSILMELPSGTVNGSNVNFTVNNTPDFIEVSGQIMVSSSVDPTNYGFTILSTSVTFVNPPTQQPHSFYQLNTNPTNLMMEIPSGTVNGVNTSFTVANTPVLVEESGQTMVSASDDPTNYGYTYSGGTITFVNPPTQTPHSFHN